jgi:NCAIR mutase (PurE)-related protein
MDPQRLRALLAEVGAGRVSVDAALERLATLPFAQVGDDLATVDHHRALRQGMPEAIYGEHKSAAQIVAVLRELERAGSRGLATRVSADKAAAVQAELPAARYLVEARLLVLGEPAPPEGRGTICVVTAGTADRAVAEEAAETVRLMGHQVARIYDVGVAGVHRTLARLPELRAASVCIVVAGMEGALPTVVGGLVARPVIAVPTSVGYGASFGGLAALLGMMNSCAAGITVVNIDNGFGAAVAAVMINRA